jgi:hypothetical protein
MRTFKMQWLKLEADIRKVLRAPSGDPSLDLKAIDYIVGEQTGRGMELETSLEDVVAIDSTWPDLSDVVKGGLQVDIRVWQGGKP